MLITTRVSQIVPVYVALVSKSSQVTSSSSAKLLLENGLDDTFTSRTGFSVPIFLYCKTVFFLAPSQFLSDHWFYVDSFISAGTFTEMSSDTFPCTHGLDTFLKPSPSPVDISYLL